MVGIKWRASQDGPFHRIVLSLWEFLPTCQGSVRVIDKNNQLGSIGECGSCDLRMGMREEL